MYVYRIYTQSKNNGYLTICGECKWEIAGGQSINVKRLKKLNC